MIENRKEFRCPNCTSPHFGRINKPKDSERTYVCYGLDCYSSEDPRYPGWIGCGWEGTKTQFEAAHVCRYRNIEEIDSLEEKCETAITLLRELVLCYDKNSWEEGKTEEQALYDCIGFLHRNDPVYEAIADEQAQEQEELRPLGEN